MRNSLDNGRTFRRQVVEMALGALKANFEQEQASDKVQFLASLAGQQELGYPLSDRQVAFAYVTLSRMPVFGSFQVLAELQREPIAGVYPVAFRPASTSPDPIKYPNTFRLLAELGLV